MKRSVICAVLLASLAALPRPASAGPANVPDKPEGVDGPWPADVKGWEAVKPGDHPRILFRKADIPTLRKRAQTSEGKAIIERIKMTFEKHRYTTWHAAGYAFMYTITEDQEYLDQAKKMIEWTFKGRGRNPDGRYKWPGDGQLRGGPCLWGLGLAYDLGYNYWDEDFRKYMINGIMANTHFDAIPNSPRHGPGCNHYGAHTGGAGACHLALRGDPELTAAQSKKIERNLEKLINNAKGEIVLGYGPGGHYYEGHHCGRLSSNTGLIPFIQAYRVAAGKDLVKHCSNAQWLSSKWIYDLFVHPDKTSGDIQRGMYCRPFDNTGGGMSGLGDFALGFGIVPEKHKASFLWTYNTTIAAGREEYDYDVTVYPIHGVYSFVNWPIGLKEQNPKELLPLVRHDPGPNYFVFRNDWTKDGSDLVVTALLGSRPRSGRGMATGGSVCVGGRGLKSTKKNNDPQPKVDHFYRFPGMFHGSKLTYKRLAVDGSGVISGIRMEPIEVKAESAPPPKIPFHKEVTSLAVDFSGASGSDLLVAMTGPQIGYMVAYWMQICGMQKPIEAQSETGWKTKTLFLRADGSISGAGGGKGPKMGGVSLDEDEESDGLGDDLDIGGGKSKGMREWVVMTIGKKTFPKVSRDGDTIKVGGQTLKFDGKKIILGKMAKEG